MSMVKVILNIVANIGDEWYKICEYIEYNWTELVVSILSNLPPTHSCRALADHYAWIPYKLEP